MFQKALQNKVNGSVLGPGLSLKRDLLSLLAIYADLQLFTWYQLLSFLYRTPHGGFRCLGTDLQTL